MSFASDNGYTPRTFNELMNEIRVALNAEFNNNYTAESFVGTAQYKYFYQLVQKAHENEVKTSEIFLKLQEYISETNERIQRPSVSNPGLIEAFESDGYTASVKRMVLEDAGKVSVCVDVDAGADDYEETRLDICNKLSRYTVGGTITEGTEEETITLSNGQEFDYKFFLPTKIPIILQLTLITSANNSLAVPDDEQIREQLFQRINSRYRLGWDFEPQKYFNTDDAPWAGEITLEYSTDTETPDWQTEIYGADFDELFTFGLEDIEVLVDP